MSRMIEEIGKIKAEENSHPKEERDLYHKNCGETLIEAGVKAYDIDITPEVYKTCAPYGFGCRIEKTCGAFAGAVSTIGLLLAEDKPTLNEKMNAATKEFAEKFIEKYDTLDCDHIRKVHRDPDRGCLAVMEGSGELLEEVLSKYID